MRVLLISDIHANLTALEAVLKAVGSYDLVWCLGDIVGYGPQPNECVRRVDELKALSIVGNHDLACLGDLDLSDFNHDARVASEWTNGVLNETSRAYLKSIAPFRTVDEQVTHAHGSPRQPIWEYLLEPKQADESLHFFETQLCFVGHTHIPTIFQSAGGRPARRMLPKDGHVLTLDPQTRYIINPGSIGQPRDGDARAAYGIFDRDADTVSFHRIAYNIKKTQKLMEMVKLPEMLISRLTYGN
jgi:predicted phosphodiesterase